MQPDPKCAWRRYEAMAGRSNDLPEAAHALAMQDRTMFGEEYLPRSDRPDIQLLTNVLRLRFFVEHCGLTFNESVSAIAELMPLRSKKAIATLPPASQWATMLMDVHGNIAEAMIAMEIARAQAEGSDAAGKKVEDTKQALEDTSFSPYYEGKEWNLSLVSSWPDGELVPDIYAATYRFGAMVGGKFETASSPKAELAKRDFEAFAKEYLTGTENVPDMKFSDARRVRFMVEQCGCTLSSALSIFQIAEQIDDRWGWQDETPKEPIGSAAQRAFKFHQNIAEAMFKLYIGVLSVCDDNKDDAEAEIDFLKEMRLSAPYEGLEWHDVQ